MTKQYLTQERRDSLEEELRRLQTEGRREIAERLKRAKEFGDLSENSEYQEARDAQARLEVRINELEEILRQSVIIEKAEAGATAIAIGSKVSLRRGKDTVQYTIVGSQDAAPSAGRVSNVSPIGKALLGRGVGDVITIQTPKGAVEYEVLGIE